MRIKSSNNQLWAGLLTVSAILFLLQERSLAIDLHSSKQLPAMTSIEAFKAKPYSITCTNGSDSRVMIGADFRKFDGTLITYQQLLILPMQSYDIILPSSTQVVEVNSESAGAVSCSVLAVDNQTQLSFYDLTKIGRGNSIAKVETFLDIISWLRLFNAGDSSLKGTLKAINASGGLQYSLQVEVLPKAVLDLNVSDLFESNTFGSVVFEPLNPQHPYASILMVGQP